MRTTKKTESTSSPWRSPLDEEGPPSGKPNASSAEVRGGELPTLAFADTRAFSTWLAANHATSRGAWLRLREEGVRHPVGHLRGGDRRRARLGVD